MKLTVIIPMFNEEKTIQKMLSMVLSQKNIHQVIVIDDGSTDASYKKAKAVKSKKIILLQHDKNLGKGQAIRTGIKHATDGLIIIQDADLEVDPKDYSKLIAPLLANQADFVSGNRWQNYHKFTLGRAGNILLTFITNRLFQTKFKDVCSCFKVGPLSVWQTLRLTANGFDIESEIMARVAKLKLEVAEVPISYRPRKYKEGKKVKPTDALKGIYKLLVVRFLSH